VVYHKKVKVVKVKALVLDPQNTKSPISLDGEHTDNTKVLIEIHPSLARVFAGKFQ